ncbi:MAG: hypothetical protein GYB48_09560 [Gammaproteobacteria bacterium]|nr:hypothetical protein [Gammaproteobacteria bacterium]
MPDDYLTITGQDFSDYLSKHCPVLKCPMCQATENLMLHADSSDGPAHLLTTPVRVGGGSFQLGNYFITCLNCGHVILFNAHQIEKWVKDRETAPFTDEKAADEGDGNE